MGYDTPKTKALWKALEKHKKPDPEDCYDSGRVTHCHLLYLDHPKKPIFEVRGWSKEKDTSSGLTMLNIRAVNWTVCAGTCSMNIKEDNADKWVILEDNPHMEVLYGR